jgi:hypothetical protein
MLLRIETREPPVPTIAGIPMLLRRGTLGASLCVKPSGLLRRPVVTRV